MDNPVQKTLNYYNKYAQGYARSTRTADVSSLYEPFESRIKPGAHILDLGCGSGRDSRYFEGRGFRVTAADGSPEMCRIAGKLLGREVRCMRFEELEDIEEYDGVWACASLLHVEREALPEILRRIATALKPHGILYASFKYGTGEAEQEGRVFQHYTEDDLPGLFCPENGFCRLEWKLTADVRPERKARWLNIVAERVDKI
ncbi:class I SAM-dependent methyltransferase [Anaerolentibacter hominis]|uniref:class I SAM-dependent methyltransferase n=1 Tax=Anaerolentibacter hominis TaxID=3079009 RepID=UPI0031B87AD6